MIKTALIALTLVTVSQTSFASLNIANTKPVTLQISQDIGKITQKDVEKIIPMDLQQTNDLNRVATQIADHSLQTWFNSAEVQGSVFGQTANSVQKKMATNITLKSNAPRAIEHKFCLQVLALQAMAKVQYTGWLNAVFNYDAKAAESMVEFSEKVFNKDLFVNHTSSSRGNISSVGIKWGW